MPEISIIMSIYREPEKWLRESIESILNQSFKDFEFIIINDYPVRTLNFEILEEYNIKDPRVKVFHNDENIGLTKSLNIALKKCSGNFIARQDADDISIDSRLETQHEFMTKNNNVIVCGSNTFNFTDSINNNKLISFPEKNFNIKLLLLFKNSISHPTVLIRNSFLKKQNLFYNEKPEADYAEDMHLWVDIMKTGEFYNIQKPLVYHRLSKLQITHRRFALSNKSLYEATLKHYNNFNHNDLVTFKSRALYKLASYFNKKNLSLNDILKIIFSSAVFFPRAVYYVFQKHFLN